VCLEKALSAKLLLFRRWKKPSSFGRETPTEMKLTDNNEHLNSF
jgi:hypothetical protein